MKVIKFNNIYAIQLTDGLIIGRYESFLEAKQALNKLK